MLLVNPIITRIIPSPHNIPLHATGIIDKQITDTGAIRHEISADIGSVNRVFAIGIGGLAGEASDGGISGDPGELLAGDLGERKGGKKKKGGEEEEEQGEDGKGPPVGEDVVSRHG